MTSGDSDKNMTMKAHIKHKAFLLPKESKNKNSRCLAASLASRLRVLCSNFLYTMASVVFLTKQGGTDVFPAVVFGTVAWGPVGRFER